jgi:hypothetical protein
MGATYVRLTEAPSAAVKRALVAAWRNIAAPRPTKPKVSKVRRKR